MSAKVFLAEENRRYDLANAGDYGEIVYLTKRPVSPFNATEASRSYAQILREFEFNPEIDFICMTGNVTSMAILTATIAGTHEFFRMLMYDASKSRYVETAWRKICTDRNLRKDVEHGRDCATTQLR